MPAIVENTARAGENREGGWVSRLFGSDGYTPEYQELKFTLHRKLLDRINLEALSSMAGERVRAEIRSAVAKLVEEEKTPLSLLEKDRVIEEILDEVFGLGPLEPLLQDPTVSDILVTTPRLVYVERGGKLYRTPVEFKDDATCCASLKRSSRAWDAAWTNPRPWWMLACRTVRASMRPLRPSPWTARCCASAASAARR